jgi:hypothetical protein
MTDAISLCWETVRVYGDPEPAHLEAAIRHVLAKQGGTWRVSLSRAASEWRIRLEQPQETQAAGVLINTTIPHPLPSGSVLRTLLAGALSRRG